MTTLKPQSLHVASVPIIVSLLIQSLRMIDAIDHMSGEDTGKEIPGLRIAIHFRECEDAKPRLAIWCGNVWGVDHWSTPVDEWVGMSTMAALRSVLASEPWLEFLKEGEFEIVQSTELEEAA